MWQKIVRKPQFFVVDPETVGGTLYRDFKRDFKIDITQLTLQLMQWSQLNRY